MPRFKFRLATLLTMREHARDQRRAELAEAYRAAQILAEQVDRFDAEFKDLRGQSVLAASPGPVQVDRLIDAQRYGLILQSQRETALARQQTLEAEVERRRLALAEADKEVRVLAKYRERQRAAHRQAENRLEVRQLDEAAARRPAGEEAP